MQVNAGTNGNNMKLLLASKSRRQAVKEAALLLGVPSVPMFLAFSCVVCAILVKKIQGLDNDWRGNLTRSRVGYPTSGFACL